MCLLAICEAFRYVPKPEKNIPGHGSTSLKSQDSEDLGGGMQQVEVVMVV